MPLESRLMHTRPLERLPIRDRSDFACPSLRLPSILFVMNASSYDSPQILTVSQLTKAIKLSLEATFPLMQIEGEVSNFTQHSSGHLYFSLKDQGATIQAVMFRGATAQLAFLPKAGDKVVVSANLTIYPQRGNYQLMVQTMRLAGVGELLAKLEQLKLKLKAKGWFAQESKKALPPYPKRIGVISSPTGAAIQDILRVLQHRYAGFHLILNPVRVQGEGAAQEVAQAIRDFNQYQLADVLIIARGGGSIEDLWAFNEEVVAQAIFESQIPLISAIGHETDFTIADFVADVRAATPSQAAELVIKERAQKERFLQQTRQQLERRLYQTLRYLTQRLKDARSQPMISNPYHWLGLKMQRIDELRQQIDTATLVHLRHLRTRLEGDKRRATALNPSLQLQHLRQKLVTWEASLARTASHVFQLKRERLAKLGQILTAINPRRLLSQGYSILLSQKTGLVINSVRTLSTDPDLRIILSDGEAATQVKDIFPS